MLKKVDKNEKIISLMMPSIADLKNPKFKINMSRAERRRQIKFERKIYNKAPSMIHEKKYVPMNCVMCDVKMKSIHDTHNPYPITELCYSKEAHLTDNPNRRCPNIQKAKKDLGYNPKISLEDGLRRSLLWYSDNQEADES